MKRKPVLLVGVLLLASLGVSAQQKVDGPKSDTPPEAQEPAAQSKTLSSKIPIEAEVMDTMELVEAQVMVSADTTTIAPISIQLESNARLRGYGLLSIGLTSVKEMIEHESLSFPQFNFFFSAAVGPMMNDYVGLGLFAQYSQSGVESSSIHVSSGTVRTDISSKQWNTMLGPELRILLPIDEVGSRLTGFTGIGYYRMQAEYSRLRNGNLSSRSNYYAYGMGFSAGLGFLIQTYDSFSIGSTLTLTRVLIAPNHISEVSGGVETKPADSAFRTHDVALSLTLAFL